jgi:elongation factor G
LARTGAIKNAGSVDAGTSVGDASPEARHHKMGVGLSAATTTFMGDSYTFIDCPGSIEFAHDMRAALPAVDAAVVVCEADEKKLPQLQIILRELEDLGIPRFLFLNKIDRANKRIRETLATLQPASRVPLVLRQIPIWNGELIEGLSISRWSAPSSTANTSLPKSWRWKAAISTARRKRGSRCWRKLADHDDALMEQLLEDIQPPRDAVFDDLARELREGLICPVLLGAAARENGVLRLMKALRHEAPGVAETAKRLGVSAQKEALAYVFKTLHLQHGGKLSLTRLLAGHLDDGATLQSSSGEAGRVSGILAVSGGHDTKRAAAEAGDTIALGKLDAIKTGDSLSSGKTAPPALVHVEPTPPVLAMSLSAIDRKDDVKLGQALLRLNEEDPSLTMIQNQQTHDIVLWGQGEMHLRVALERLKERFRRQRQIAAARRSAIRRPSANRPPSAAVTRSSPAAMASSATWCWRSSRCRAAAASSSTRRWSAAPCRAIISARSRRAWSTASRAGRSASRSSIFTSR